MDDRRVVRVARKDEVTIYRETPKDTRRKSCSNYNLYQICDYLKGYLKFLYKRCLCFLQEKTFTIPLLSCSRRIFDVNDSSHIMSYDRLQR